MLMSLKTKCPDCGAVIERSEPIFEDEGFQGSLSMICTGCHAIFSVQWRLTVKTKVHRVNPEILDQAFQIQLKADAEQGEDDER